MDELLRYLVGVVESSYQDLGHLVPCGSFLGVFDERPTQMGQAFSHHDSQTACQHITRLSLSAIQQHPLQVLGMLVDTARNIHDASPVLDIAFRSLYEVYQTRIHSSSDFGSEYLLLTRLFELHRPRTWIAAVRLISMVTKLSINQPTAPLSSTVCRQTIHRVWRLLLDSSASESAQQRFSKSTRRTRWQIRFDASMELFDSLVGRLPFCLGRPLVSYQAVARELHTPATMVPEIQRIVDMCCQRKQRLGRILLPPDGSWPLIAHASRAHTVKHVYDQPAYALFRDSLTWEEQERGPSAGKYVADLLYQRAPTDEIIAAIRNHRINRGKVQTEGMEDEDTERARLVLDAMVGRVRDVVGYIRQQCDFQTLLDERQMNQYSDNTMVVPSRIQYWELMNEVADQLFYFVLFNTIQFKDVHRRLYQLVFPPDSDIRIDQKTHRDNSYIWLLLQLFHIEHVSSGPIKEDLESGREDLLDQWLQMYDEQQIVSQDAFYLRDLSLQAAMSHQQSQIRDNQGVKFRHPRMEVAMPFAPIVYRLRHEFGQQFREENYGALDGTDLCRVMKTAMVSQLHQYVVPNTLYTYLVPSQENVLKLQDNPTTTYLRGGRIGYKLLDYINVGGKHRLLQLIYKMMLAHELGPQFQFDGQQPAVHQGITCVSPHILDSVYRILYNAPYATELMMKEVLEKLRLCDKVMEMGNARFSPATLRWLYTIYQLMNCRLLRFFKYYAHASHLVHHLRHSLVHVTHRQLYSSLECFALCLVNLQHDVEFLQALMDPGYHGVLPTQRAASGGEGLLAARQITRYVKPEKAWFECEMLSRNAVMVVARIVRMRGLGDVPGLSLADCLDSLSPRPQYWCSEVLQYLPDAVQDYYAGKQVSPPTPASLENVSGWIEANQCHGRWDGEEMVRFYQEDSNRQPMFLLAVWDLLIRKRVAIEKIVVGVRKVLLSFPSSQMSTYTSVLLDHILCAFSVDESKDLLDAFVFKHHLIRHEHLVFALVRGDHNLSSDQPRLSLIRFFLLDSPSFKNRLDEWGALDFQGRYWADHEHWAKQETYLRKFPEYFEYESQIEDPRDPPLALRLPVYYENAMVRLLPVLEYALGRLIEAADRQLLKDVLDRMGILYRLHQVPLTTLMNTLVIYYRAPALNDAGVLRSLCLSLLDLSQQNFSTEFETFVRGSDIEPPSAEYIKRMISHVSGIVERKLQRPGKEGLPEIHYREIPNPILLELTESVVELLVWWCLYRDQWPLSELWLEEAMRANRRASDIHTTALLANVLPDSLLAFPIVQGLTQIVLGEPELQKSSDPHTYFSFTHKGAFQPPTTGGSSIFDSFEQNRLTGNTNRPNTYLTLLHSTLHFGGIATFTVLADTIHQLSDQIVSDLQLLYLCATAGPILYRLVGHSQLYCQILGDLVGVLVKVCPRLELDAVKSTEAVEQVMDFFWFVRDQFHPGHQEWFRLVGPYLSLLPEHLGYQLR